VSSNGYSLLGFVVWRGAKWYLRRRLPSRRRVVATVLVAGTCAVAVGVVARRLAGSART